MAENTDIANDSVTQSSRMTRFLKIVENLGNALPHPVTLFALFALGVILLSGILGWMDVSVADPRPLGAKGRARL